MGLGGVNPGGLAHFPGAGSPRGCLKEAEGLVLTPCLGQGEVCGFCLCWAGFPWFPAPTGGFCGSGLAHFEMGGAHFPRPDGLDVVSGDGEVVGLLLERPQPLGCALTWTKQRVCT